MIIGDFVDVYIQKTSDGDMTLTVPMSAVNV